MMDPAEIARIAAQAVSGAGDKGELEGRGRQRQLSFSAMLAAAKGDCNCDACRLLREAVELFQVRPREEGLPHGASDNPAA